MFTNLRIRTHAATKEYASKVPIDIMSTSAFKSNRKAMIAVKKKQMLNIYRKK